MTRLVSFSQRVTLESLRASWGWRGVVRATVDEAVEGVLRAATGDLEEPDATLLASLKVSAWRSNDPEAIAFEASVEVDE